MFLDVGYVICTFTPIVKCFQQQKHIMAERNVLLKNMKHPFLVGLHYSFQTTDQLYFVLDFVNGGEVSSFTVIHNRHTVESLRSKHRKPAKKPWDMSPDLRARTLYKRWGWFHRLRLNRIYIESL
jgi:serine/threonine protein kinase